MSIMWLNDSTEKVSRHYVHIYHRIWQIGFTCTLNLHVHICVHTLYMIVLTLQNSCALRYIYMYRVESLGQRVYGAGVRDPSFIWGVFFYFLYNYL